MSLFLCLESSLLNGGELFLITSGEPFHPDGNTSQIGQGVQMKGRLVRDKRRN